MRYVWGLVTVVLCATAFAMSEGGATKDGVTVACDLPLSLRTKNVGGSDGAGLCVFTSIGHAARYNNVPVLKDFQQYMRQFPGGGYPEKVDAYIKRKCREANVPVPDYFQYEGKDTQLLERAIKSGRMVSVTYDGRDVHYRGRIAHMVNLVHIDHAKDVAVILDNNFVGEQELVWLTIAEFKSRWLGGGQGWAVILRAPAPAPRR